MQGDERHQELWKGQEDRAMTMISAEDVCARARFLEKEAVWGWRYLAAMTALLAPLYVYQLMRIHNASVFAALSVILVGWCALAWRVRKPTGRKQPAEPCASFLRRTLEQKRKGYFFMSRLVLSLSVPIFMAWMGHGPADAAKARGITSPALLKLLAGPEYFLLVAPVLAFCWFGFWHTGRKMESEMAKLDREA